MSLFILLALPVCLFAQQPIFPLFAQNPRWRIDWWNYNGGWQPITGTNEYFYQKSPLLICQTGFILWLSMEKMRCLTLGKLLKRIDTPSV